MNEIESSSPAMKDKLRRREWRRRPALTVETMQSFPVRPMKARLLMDPCSCLRLAIVPLTTSHA